MRNNLNTGSPFEKNSPVRSEKTVLDTISAPSRIRKLTPLQMELLANDLRREIIETVSQTGGHLASNLGVVELTLALLCCFSTPDDKIVWDVGHQCYAYKLLTGRRDKFSTLRQEGGISGFPKTEESRYDTFIAGHASTSLAAAFGIKCAMTLNNDPHSVIAVIGDGSMTGGMAYEGLNNIGKSGENLIIILNDNEMAISKNEGALARYLAVMRSRPEYFKVKSATDATLRSIPLVGEKLRDFASQSKSMVKNALYPSTFFEEFGFTYYGPVDGHNVRAMCEVLRQAKSQCEPAIIHVKTVKGKGYTHAERNPGAYHGVSKFDIKTGAAAKLPGENFSEVFGRTLLEMGRQNDRICAVTAAMEHGTCLQYFAREFKSEGRFYDVGIAEELAVTFCAALSAGGRLPVLAIYSTFLQRGYDQIIHDAAIEKRHIIFAIDRAGIVGDDGETHQGLFDAAFLSTVPGILLYSPANYAELEVMLHTAATDCQGPVAVRYPRGAQDEAMADYKASGNNFDHIDCGELDCAVVIYGKITAEAVKAKQLTDKKYSIIKLNRIVPIDGETVKLACKYKRVVFVEEGISRGGIASQFMGLLALAGYKGVAQMRAIDDFVPQGKTEAMLKRLGLDAEGIAKLLDNRADQ